MRAGRLPLRPPIQPPISPMISVPISRDDARPSWSILDYILKHTLVPGVKLEPGGRHTTDLLRLSFR